MFKKITFVFFLAQVALSCPSFSQNWDPNSEEMLKELESIQKKMMEQFQSFQSDSSSFFFRFDTAFSGQGGLDFFKMPPNMGNGQSFGNFFGDFGALEKQLNQLFGRPYSDATPKDDGEIRTDENDLLPEEKLREQPEGEPSEKPEQLKPKTEKPAKPRRQGVKI